MKQKTDGSMMAERAMEAVYSCEICGQDGLAEGEMRMHMLNAHIEGAISCPFCDLSDISANDMVLHVNSVHLDYLSPDHEGGHPPQTLDNRSHFQPCNYLAADASACGSSPFAVPASPHRPSLSLNLQRGAKEGSGGASTVASPMSYNGFHASPNACGGGGSRVTQCPICGFGEPSPTKLQEHVNRQHFDLTSPSFPDVSPMDDEEGSVRATYGCPLCARRFQCVPDLELHVSMEHKDVLSPSRSSRSTPADENSNDSCPVCGSVGFRSVVEMATHIEDHFEKKTPTATSMDVASDVTTDCLLAQEIERQEREARKLQEQKEFELLQAQYGMDNHGNFKDQSLANMQKAVYSGEMSVDDYYNRQHELKAAEMNGVDDRHSCTKGLVPRVRAISINGNNVIGVSLCTTVDHYGSTYGDRGWGCGYRNIQMMLSSLMHHTGYNEKLFSGQNVMPSISKLQELIECAWRKGFDPLGCEQLGGKLVNTRKWIGTTEVITFLSSFRVRCHLLDFHRPTGPDGTHPELFQWVLQYFKKEDDFKAPLYLQHQGHSRTIFGAEQMRDGGIRLLVLDPSHSKAQMEMLCTTATATNGMRLIRRPLVAMKARQYQIVAIAGIIETDQEYQQSKILRSVRIPREH